MASDDFTSADSMVLGCVCLGTLNHEDADHVMKSIERYAVRADWFRDPSHQAFFAAVEKAWKETNQLDVYHIKERYDGIVPMVEIYEKLIDHAVTTVNLEHYLDALKSKHVYSKVHKMMAEQLQEMKPDSIGIQIEDFVKKLHDFQEEIADHDSGLKQLSDYMEESIKKKTKLHEERFVKHNWAYMDGMPWPWHEVNQIFAGLKTGLHIVGALASQGKSTIAVDLSTFWNSKGYKHGYFSIDMAADQYADRYPCVSELVSLAKLNFGGSHQDLEKFRNGFQKQAQFNNVWLSEADDTKTIEYQCYRGVRSLGWKAIIIDYIQLVTYDEGKGNLPEYTRVQRCVQAIKKIAKKLKVPIICLAQLSRAFEKELRDSLNAAKGNVEPGLDAIGDSAEIARAAASVTVLYQDEDMRRYWKENPPTQLAFGDKSDRAVQYGVVLQRNEFGEPRRETEQEAIARRQGQLSLAKALRPVWFEVLKNQQGGRGKIPFVMFANYFLFRPGNSEGMDVEVQLGQKTKKLPVGKFEQLRDDWIYTDQDWWLEMTNAMPQRGCKLMGETYAEMRARQEEERAAHPEVRHFVREYDAQGKNEIGWHWQEPTV